MNTVKHTAPACWAQYLLHGIAGRLPASEIAAADAFLKRIGLGAPIGHDKETFFANSHDARRWGIYPLAADCYSYQFSDTAGE